MTTAPAALPDTTPQAMTAEELRRANALANDRGVTQFGVRFVSQLLAHIAHLESRLAAEYERGKVDQKAADITMVENYRRDGWHTISLEQIAEDIREGKSDAR